MVRFDRPWKRRPPGQRPVATLGVLALGVSGLFLAAPPAAAAGDDSRTTLPGGMAERTVIAASGTSLLVSTTGSRIPDKVSTDDGAHFVPFTPTIPPNSTIAHVAHGKVVWATAGGGGTTLYTYDFGNTAPVKTVVNGWVEAVDAHTAVLRSDVAGVTTRSAQNLVTGEIHPLAFTSPTDSATAATTVDVDDGSLVLATTTTTDSEGLAANGYLDLQPANGEVSSAAREVVPGLVAGVLRGDQVVYATVAAQGFSVCFRDVAGWATPSCQPFTVAGLAGLADPLRATAALAVGPDWVLVTPRWGSGSQAQLVVAGTTVPAAPVAVVPPAADRVQVFSAGDSERPLAAVWKGSAGYIGQVGASGTIANLFTHPTSPAAVASLSLTPDRLVGLDSRPGGNTSDYQSWQRPVSDNGIEPETLLNPRTVAIGASSARTLLDDGTKLRVFDAGRATGSLTPPKYGVSVESLSGPYFYGRTVAYDEVLRVDGAVQRKGQVRALFGSQALMLTNASLNRYEVADVTSTTSVRVQVPAIFEPASFDALGLWGDYVLGFNTLGRTDTPTAVVLNFRTHQYWQHPGYPIEVGDGFVVLQVPAGTTDPNSDDELAVWNLRTGSLTLMPDRDWQAVATDGSHRLAYSTGSQLVVRQLTGIISSAPRALGVLAPASLNLITGTGTWKLAVDATKALTAGTLTIENSSGAVVRHVPAAATTAGAVRVSWDGRDDGANLVPVGTYRWRLSQRAGDGSGNLIGADGSVVTGTIAVLRAPLGTVAGSVPAISDRTPVVGQNLVAGEGAWSPTSGLAFTYAWYRSGRSAPIGVTRTYRVVPADLGTRLRVRVTGAVQHWTSARKVSADTGKVGKGRLGAPIPTIDPPAAKVGQVLTARPGVWTPAGTVPSYRWYRVSAGGRSTALKGQTAATLTVGRSLAGYRLKVKVTGRLPAYTTRSVYSARTAKITRS